MCDGLIITVTVTISVSSLTRCRKKESEDALYMRALKYIDRCMVADVVQQGFTERVAIKAVLATSSESLEKALHWAIANCEA